MILQNHIYINCQLQKGAHYYSIMTVMATQLYGEMGHHQTCISKARDQTTVHEQHTV